MIFPSKKNKYTFKQRKEDGEEIHRHGFCGGFMGQGLIVESLNRALVLFWLCFSSFSSSSTVNMAFLNNQTALKGMIGSCQASVGSVKIWTLLFHSCPCREPSGMLEGRYYKGCQESPQQAVLSSFFLKIYT